MNNEKMSFKEAYDLGYRRICLGLNDVRVRCNLVFKYGEATQCSCGCDLFGYLVSDGDGKIFLCLRNKIEKDSILCE